MLPGTGLGSGSAIALAVAISLWIVRGIRRGVVAILDSLDGVRGESGELSTALDAAAGGDLTVEVVSSTEAIENLSGDEIGRVGGAVNAIRDTTAASVGSYNRMREGLHALVADLSSAAQTVAGSSQETASRRRTEWLTRGPGENAPGPCARSALSQPVGLGANLAASRMCGSCVAAACWPGPRRLRPSARTWQPVPAGSVGAAV